MQQAQAGNIVKSMTREDSNFNPKIVRYCVVSKPCQ